MNYASLKQKYVRRADFEYDFTEHGILNLEHHFTDIMSEVA